MLRPSRCRCLILILGSLATVTGMACHAAGPSAPAVDDIETRLRAFVVAQVARVDARVTVTFAGARPSYGPCHTPQFYLPARQTRLAGPVTVGLRCPGDRPARRYYPIRVGIEMPYVVAADGIDTGDVLASADLRLVQGDITRLGARAVVDVNDLIGRVAQRRIAAGMPVLQDMTARATVVDRGDSVRLIAQGRGFSIATDGLALNSAAIGERVRVRTRAGATVEGRAHADGTVTLLGR